MAGIDESPAREAYAAALLDGEGWVGVRRSKDVRLRHHGRSHVLCVTFAMTDRGPIDFIERHWSAFKSDTRLLKSGRVLYRVRLQSTQAIRFLTDVQPYVLGKQRQVEAALRFPLRPKSNRRISDADFDLREALYSNIRVLNSHIA